MQQRWYYFLFTKISLNFALVLYDWEVGSHGVSPGIQAAISQVLCCGEKETVRAFLTGFETASLDLRLLITF